MSAIGARGSLKALIILEEGLLDRRLFVDPDIYALEQERVFARC